MSRRAGIYTRMSQDRSGEAAGVGRQEADCRELAERLSWSVVDVYCDNDTSATSGRRRKEWERLMRDLESGTINSVLAYSSSRMYRKLRDLTPLLKLAEDGGVKIETVVSGRVDLATADGRMMAGILASIDQGEAERTSERVRREKHALREKGIWLGGGRRPYGYDRVSEPDMPVYHVVREDEAQILREAARRVLDGESIYRVVVDFNSRRETTASGKRWNSSVLRRLLTTPFHAGLTRQGKQSGQWPAILTTDQHELLKVRLPQSVAKPGRGKGPRPNARKYVLTGLVRCECGLKLLGGDSYRCSPGRGGCGKTYITARPLEKYVDEEAHRYHDLRLAHVVDFGEWPDRDGNPQRIRVWMGHEDREPKQFRADPSPLVEELRAAENRWEVIQGEYADGEHTLEAFRVIRARIEQTIAKLREQIGDALPAVGPSRSFLRKLDEPGEAEDFYARMEQRELTPVEVADYHAYLSRYIDHVTITPATTRGRKALANLPERVDIVWRG